MHRPALILGGHLASIRPDESVLLRTIEQLPVGAVGDVDGGGADFGQPAVLPPIRGGLRSSVTASGDSHAAQF